MTRKFVSSCHFFTKSEHDPSSQVMFAVAKNAHRIIFLQQANFTQRELMV